VKTKPSGNGSGILGTAAMKQIPASKNSLICRNSETPGKPAQGTLRETNSGCSYGIKPLPGKACPSES
jgi:hypothetical protein